MPDPIRARIRFAYTQTRASKSVTVNPVSTFMFFLLAGAGLVWRFRLGDVTFFARYVDWVAVDEIALRGEYTQVVSELLAGKEKPVIVDLGANIGLFSALVFRQVPSAIAHAVEPSYATYRILEKNRKANPKLDWRTHWSAMWGTDGEVHFVEDGKASTASHVGADRGYTVVPAMSLATLFAEHVRTPIDLLKVDVEGAEEVVLCSNPTLLKQVEALIVEIHPYRCDQARVVRTLEAGFDYLYDVRSDRASRKPLLLASRRRYNVPCTASPGGSV